jgi:hypothetical protein
MGWTRNSPVQTSRRGKNWNKGRHSKIANGRRGDLSKAKGGDSKICGNRQEICRIKIGKNK